MGRIVHAWVAVEYEVLILCYQNTCHSWQWANGFHRHWIWKSFFCFLLRIRKKKKVLSEFASLLLATCSLSAFQHKQICTLLNYFSPCLHVATYSFSLFAISTHHRYTYNFLLMANPKDVPKRKRISSAALLIMGVEIKALGHRIHATGAQESNWFQYPEALCLSRWTAVLQELQNLWLISEYSSLWRSWGRGQVGGEKAEFRSASVQTLVGWMQDNFCQVVLSCQFFSEGCQHDVFLWSVELQKSGCLGASCLNTTSSRRFLPAVVLTGICPVGVLKGQVRSELCCSTFLSQSTCLLPQLLGTLILPTSAVTNYLCDLCQTVKLN